MDFLQSCIRQFKGTKKNVEQAIAQLPDEDLHWQPDPESNSIAIIMKHMAGNMVSRWTDFLTSDGEKPDRNRDGEFIDDLTSRAQLVAFWERGWTCTFNALEALKPEDLEKTVYIRSEAHSVPLAIIRQVAHYGYHAGQIVYVAKHRAGSDWQTLSIPRNRQAVK
jgi:hypothetical protein